MKLSYFKDCLLTVIEHWRTREQTVHYRKFAAPSVRTVGPGRPKFEIELEQLEELRYIGLTWTDIAKLLGVSRMTMYRARQELGYEKAGDRNVTDADLQQLVSTIKDEMPNVGEILHGILRSKSDQEEVTPSNSFCGPIRHNVVVGNTYYQKTIFCEGAKCVMAFRQ